jgi:hypothetical protein
MAAVTNNDFRVNSSSLQVPSQGSGKEQRDAAVLNEVARSLREIAGEAGAVRTRDPQSGRGEVSSEKLKAIMVELMLLLSDHQIAIAEKGKERSDRDASIGTSISDAMQSRLDEAKAFLQGTVDDLKQGRVWGAVAKVAGVALTALATVSCPALVAAVVVGMTVLSESGVLSKVTQGISEELQKQGMSRDEANLMAAGIVVLVVTAVSAGAGAAAAGTGTAASTGRAAASEAGTATASRGSQAVGMGVIGGSTAIGATNFGSYLAAIVTSGMAEGTEKEALTFAIQIAVTLATLAAGLSAGAAAGSGPSVLERFNGSKATALLEASRVTTQVATVTEVGAGIGEGITQMGLADKTVKLARVEAENDFLKANLDAVSKGETARRQQLVAVLKGLTQHTAEIGRGFVAGAKAVTDALQEKEQN